MQLLFKENAKVLYISLSDNLNNKYLFFIRFVKIFE